MIRLLLFLLLATAAVATWLLPTSKPGAIAGRLTYLQSLLLVLSTIWAVVFAILAFTPRRLLRPVSFRIVTVVLAGTLVLLLIEAACYFLPARAQMDNPWYTSVTEAMSADEQLPYLRPPNLRWEGRSRGDLAMLSTDPDPWARRIVFQTDHQGFHNAVSMDRADVVFVGDSFTEAGNTPEEETFVRRVAQRTGLSCRNLGLAGYTVSTELILFKRFGLPCDPKVVVWQLSESNDLEEEGLFADWVAQDRPPDYFGLREQHAQTRTRSAAWKRRSPTYRLFTRLRESFWTFRGTFTPADEQQVPVYFLYPPGPGQLPSGHKGWPPLKQSLTEGLRLLQEKQITPIVIFIPTKYHALSLSPRLQFDRSTLSLQPSGEFAAAVGELCRREGVTFLDLTPVLAGAAAQGELVYLPMDTHLSPAGHRIVGEVTANAIEKMQDR